MDPATSDKEYVRSQRGALTETPMALMQSWVDKTAEKDNVWLGAGFSWRGWNRCGEPGFRRSLVPSGCRDSWASRHLSLLSGTRALLCGILVTVSATKVLC